MNERLKQLAIESKLIAPEYNGFDHTSLSISQQRFAELIVRECMEQIHIQSRGPCGDYHGEWYESDILKHFGVEE
jgi:hypothetical protein